MFSGISLTDQGSTLTSGPADPSNNGQLQFFDNSASESASTASTLGLIPSTVYDFSVDLQAFGVASNNFGSALQVDIINGAGFQEQNLGVFTTPDSTVTGGQSITDTFQIFGSQFTFAPSFGAGNYRLRFLALPEGPGPGDGAEDFFIDRVFLGEAVPEPSCALLSLLGSLAVLRRRR